MDLSPVLMPGVQSVVTAILGDAWTSTRDLILRRLKHDGDQKSDAAAEAEAEQVSHELELFRTRSLEPFANAEPDRRFLEGFWYCHLARMLDDHPGLADVLAELAAGAGEAQPSVSVVSNVAHINNVSVVNSGEAGRLLQNSGDIHGGVTMN
jgi:hypothetical protein